MENACSNIITANPADVILFVFALIVLIALVWCIWAFFYAIFLFIFSKGDNWKWKSGWDCIRYMIVWLFLTVMILFMAPTVLKVFRMRNYNYYSAKYIFVKVWNIVTCVTTWITRVLTDYPNNNPFWDTSDPLWITDAIGWSYNDGTTVYEL